MSQKKFGQFRLAVWWVKGGRYEEYTERNLDAKDFREVIGEAIARVLRFAVSKGVAMVLKERLRQFKKGYDAAHDATHEADGQLADAAYMILFDHTQGPGCVDDDDEPDGWHQALALKLRKAEPVERLKVAGALLAAEIDRLEVLPTPPASRG